MRCLQTSKKLKEGLKTCNPELSFFDNSIFIETGIEEYQNPVCRGLTEETTHFIHFKNQALHPWFKSLIFKELNLGWKYNNLFAYGENAGIGVENGKYGVTQDEVQQYPETSVDYSGNIPTENANGSFYSVDQYKADFLSGENANQKPWELFEGIDTSKNIYPEWNENGRRAQKRFLAVFDDVGDLFNVPREQLTDRKYHKYWTEKLNSVDPDKPLLDKKNTIVILSSHGISLECIHWTNKPVKYCCTSMFTHTQPEEGSDQKYGFSVLVDRNYAWDCESI